MKEVLTAGEIKKQYADGRRNFDGIKSNSQDFQGFVLKGCSFVKADLSWSLLDVGDFSDCDFTGANLTWSGIRRVNLRNTKFIKANVSYCDFDSSTFDNTDFSNADLTASLLFNVNLGGAILKGANMAWTATHISQLSEAGLKFVIERLEGMGRTIPPEILAKFKLITVKIHDKKRQLEAMSSGYAKAKSDESKISYAQRMKGFENEINQLYDSLQNLYTKVVTYEPKQKKDDIKMYK